MKQPFNNEWEKVYSQQLYQWRMQIKSEYGGSGNFNRLCVLENSFYINTFSVKRNFKTRTINVFTL